MYISQLDQVLSDECVTPVGVCQLSFLLIKHVESFDSVLESEM